MEYRVERGPMGRKRDPTKSFLIRLFVNALALTAAATFIDGIDLGGGFWDVLLVAFVFGLLNSILKPILFFFSFPLILLSLGVFALVLNALMLLLTARFLDSFSVSGFWTAVLGSLVISVVTMILEAVLREGERG